MSVSLFIRRAVPMCLLSAVLFVPGVAAISKVEFADKEGTREVTREVKDKGDNDRTPPRELPQPERQVTHDKGDNDRTPPRELPQPEKPVTKEQEVFDHNMDNAAQVHERLQKESQEKEDQQRERRGLIRILFDLFGK